MDFCRIRRTKLAKHLSFSTEFFIGTKPLYEISESDKPNSVVQAIISMSEEEKVELNNHQFQYKGNVDDEDWLLLVLDRVRETNTCDNYETPVSVWIDKEGFWRLDIYE